MLLILGEHTQIFSSRTSCLPGGRDVMVGITCERHKKNQKKVVVAQG
uniref:Uncharacterized protein n=1 Tax=Arundo donax TaxID=35708 RepID=A0A0A9GUX1_ARUDO